MNDLRELYQQLILDHNQNPRNFHELEAASHHAHGHNPLCGDEIDIYLLLDGDIITDVAFTGSGCAISKASASIMTTLLKGKTRSEALKIFENFQHLATTGKRPEAGMGKLEALADVHKYPARVKCAMLAWRTLEASFEQKSATVSTE